MKIKVTGKAMRDVKNSLVEASEFFKTPSSCTAWCTNAVDPATGELISPSFELGERVTFHPGIVSVHGVTVYRNCHGETLAVIEDNNILLIGRRHQSLYGAPNLGHLPEGPNPEIEVIETSMPELGWWETNS